MNRFAICAGILLFLGIAYCLKVVPERTSILYVNKEEIEDGKFYVSRYGRKSGYYLNVEGKVLRAWGNNATAHLIFYEYLHNEYRRSFVEMHFKGCDLLMKEAYIGAMFKRVGVTCPIVGEYHLKNLTVQAENFKFKVPFEKVLVDIVVNATNFMLAHGQIYLHFEKI